MPASYQEIAENGLGEMYYALVNEDSILNLLSISNMKIFCICRFDNVADDGSTAHEHIHAL